MGTTATAHVSTGQWEITSRGPEGEERGKTGRESKICRPWVKGGVNLGANPTDLSRVRERQRESRVRERERERREGERERERERREEINKG